MQPSFSRSIVPLSPAVSRSPCVSRGQAGADGKTGAQGPGTIAAIGMDLSGLVGPYGTVASGLDTWAGR